MTDQYSGLALLRSLGDFDDPLGPASQLQTDTLMAEMRELAIKNPDTKFQMSEDGPAQTITEILAEIDADDAMLVALKAGLKL